MTSTYRGAETCDFVPEFNLDDDGNALCRAVFDAKVGDHTPALILADLLEERNDPRHERIRFAVELEQKAANLKARSKPKSGWEYDERKAAFSKLTSTVDGWKLSCLIGALSSRWSPSGMGCPQHETWADVRIDAVTKGIWFWFCDLSDGEDAAWSQAYATGRQAYAAGRQAYAAGRQAYAAEQISFDWQRRFFKMAVKTHRARKSLAMA